MGNNCVEPGAPARGCLYCGIGTDDESIFDKGVETVGIERRIKA